MPRMLAELSADKESGLVRTAFDARARKAPGVVGIWHETYVVERAEPVCGGMPPTGLARATSTVPVGRNVDRAAARLAGGQTRWSLS